ncbi:MAG: hypothetical protein JOY96_11285 [Verrucomicrobia bacterium]|nr:hypothetical protein [Verrucomicrobiota bacterium]
MSASEQKADAAQKSADEIAKERDHLQTESATGANRINVLKKSLDELTNERNELQTRLLGMRSSAESLQKIAANAPGQISSLLNQLRETQKKADLAQKNADEISTERDALQAAARESANKIDTVQRSLDELRNERNGLQGQLKEVQSRADAAQKIAAIAPSQIAALQSQLRESQQRADSAQKNVVETAALRTERDSLQKQVVELGFKAEAARKGADLSKQEREKSDGQLQTLRNRLPRQTRSEINVMKATASTPSSESDLTPKTEPNMENAIRRLVLDYLRSVSNDDVALQRRFFSDKVDFYGRGVISATDFQEQTVLYHRRWPSREWLPSAPAKIIPQGQRGQYLVMQPFRWTVSDGSQSEHGNSTLDIKVEMISANQFRITKVRQED